jgi:hypothetical protein
MINIEMDEQDDAFVTLHRLKRAAGRVCGFMDGEGRGDGVRLNSY